MPANAPSVVFIGGGPRTAGVAGTPRRQPAGALRRRRWRSTSWSRTTPGSGRIWRYDQHPGPDAQLGRRGRHHVHRRLRAMRGPGRGRARAWPTGPPGSWTAPSRTSRSFPRTSGDQLQHLTGATFPTRQLQSLPGMVLPPRRRALGPDATVTVHRDTAPSAIEPVAATLQSTTHGPAHRVRLAGGADAARRRRGRRPGAHRFAAGRGVRRVGRLRRPARRVPRGAQLHHRRRLFTHRPGPGRDCLRHGPGVRGPAGPADGGPRRPVRGNARRRPALPAVRRRAAAVGRVPARRALPLQDLLHPARRSAPGRRASSPPTPLTPLLDAPRRAGLPHPALAPDRQGRRLRLLPRAVHRLPGAGPAWAGTEFAERFAAAGLVQPGPRAARGRVRPGRRPAPGPRTAGPPLRRAASSPGRRTSRPPWHGYIEHDLELRDRPGPLRNPGPVHWRCSRSTWSWAGWSRPSGSTPGRSRTSTAGGTGSSASSTPGRRRAGCGRCWPCTGPGCCSSSARGWRSPRTSPPGRFVATLGPVRRHRVRPRRLSRPGFRRRRWPAPRTRCCASCTAPGSAPSSSCSPPTACTPPDGCWSRTATSCSARSGSGRRAACSASGPGTSGWGAGAFARPGTNAAPFRENDALARRILTARWPGTATRHRRQSGRHAAVPQPAAVGKDLTWTPNHPGLPHREAALRPSMLRR